MGADLRGASFAGAKGSQCFFGEAKLDAASFVNGLFPQAVFERAELGKADLSGAFLEEVYFGYALAAEARFRDAKLRSADFSHADVTGADFTGAGLFRTKFHRAKRDGATLTRAAGWLGDDDELARIEGWRPLHGATRADQDSNERIER
jgi:uncharacterized protein YjbI with pentapeptide repeats